MQAFWQTSGDPQSADAGRKELGRYLPVLEQALDGREWLEGDFSLADIAYAPHLGLVVDGGFDMAPYPRVSQWLARLRARPAWRRAAEMIFGG
jgi:glutathione S-transferase